MRFFRNLRRLVITVRSFCRTVNAVDPNKSKDFTKDSEASKKVAVSILSCSMGTSGKEVFIGPKKWAFLKKKKKEFIVCEDED